MNQKPDARRYDVGDEVEFTGDDGKLVPGVVHAVRYQQGRYELVGCQHEIADDPTSPHVPGTGVMELVKGTETERHSFEYIMVHKHEHRAWWKAKNDNEAKLKVHAENVKKYHEKVKNIPKEEHYKYQPESPLLEEHPPLTQFVRVYEEDA